MNKKNNLLLSTSTIFENSTLIDCIRQSYIDLNQSIDKELIEKLLEDALEKLNEKISNDVANELIALILKCFQCLSTDPLPFLNTLFEKSKTNLYALISFFSVLSYLINNKKDLDLSVYNSFVEKALKEIQPQIQNKKQLILFDYTIPSLFKSDLIYDIILSSNVTEQLIDDFSSFYLGNKNVKTQLFLRKATNAGFITSLLFLLLKDHEDDEEYSSNINDENDDLQLDIINEIIDDEFLSRFLSHRNPETDKKLQNDLFKKMLSDKSNFLGYLQIIFENLKGLKIKPKLLLEYFNDEYKTSEDDFIKVLDNVFVLHPTEKVFIPQPSYKQLNLPNSEFNTKIVNTLLNIVKKDPGNFQAFYCLECIACSFPFIFSFEPISVFESILPAFDNYKLIFEKTINDEEKDEKKARKGKAAIAAISFLLFTLNSTKVFDSFVSWFFENIKIFSLSQLLCIIITFLNVSQTDLLISTSTLFIKNHFFEVFSDILLKKVPNNLFGENFNKYLFLLLHIQHFLHTTFSSFDVLSIEVNLHKDNLFYEASGKRITHSKYIVPSFNSNLIHVDDDDKLKLNQKLFLFFENAQKLVPNWILENREKSNETISQKAIDDFIIKYNSLIEEKPTEVTEDIDIHYISDKITISQVRALVPKEYWVMKYLINKEKFPLLSKYYEILSDVVKNLSTTNEEIIDDDKNLLKNFNKEKYFHFYHESHDFIHNLFKRFTKSSGPLIPQFKDYLDDIPFDEDDFDIVFTSIHDNFLNIEKEYPPCKNSTRQAINVNFAILISFVQKQIKSKTISSSKFTRIYFEKLGDFVIDFVLKPQFRCDEKIMMLNYLLLKSFEKYPNRVLHVIGFMLLSDDKTIQKCATKLCLGLNDEQLKNLDILNQFFIKEIKSENPRISIISNIMRSASSFASGQSKKLTDILEKSLENCQKHNNNNDDEDDSDEEEEDEEEEAEDEDEDMKEIFDDHIEKLKLTDFIIQLLDFLSPDRDEASSSLGIPMIASKQNENKNENKEQSHSYQISDYIYNKNPHFWDIFQKYRSLINEILLKKFDSNKMIELPGIIGLLLSISKKNFSSRFVSNYSDCLNFDLRSTYFHQLVHDDLNFVCETELAIDPENIMNDSFNQLSKKTVNEWKRAFKITYNENVGFDAGGITKDWLTKLTNEIIDPKQNLFEVSTNQNYLPSRSQYAKSPEGLEKLKFMGMITARSLMQGILIPFHLTKSFLKQILHQESKIKESDLEDADEVFFESIEFYKSYNFTSNPQTDVRFEVYEDGGKIIELIENGSQVLVNDENKNKYIELMTKYRLLDSIKEQVKAFCEGFDSIIEHKNIKMFTPKELDLLICGIPKIDVDDLRNNVKYEWPYDSETSVIELFFDVIKEWNDENLTKLLIFITGMSRMPANGFVFFKQINKQIRIINGGDKSRLPCAHICTNTLELPQYTSKDEMNTKLLTAINVDDFQIK